MNRTAPLSQRAKLTWIMLLAWAIGLTIDIPVFMGIFNGYPSWAQFVMAFCWGFGAGLIGSFISWALLLPWYRS